MAKLYFRYGAMNCGKTTALLQVAYNYEEKGKNVIIIKSIIDTKGNDTVISRLGLFRKVDILLKVDERIKDLKIDFSKISCILVDEAHFLTEDQINELWVIAKKKDIPVICYGLRTDFQSNSFSGSKRLLEISDSLEELVTICSCGKRARFQSRKVNDKYVFEGEKVLIDGSRDDVIYESLCGECYIRKVFSLKE